MSKTVDNGGERRLILDDVSFSIAPGEFVSLIGPSGCGKTTLLKLVAGLTSADAGEILVHGEHCHRATRAKSIGLVPQQPALLPWRTVRSNVELPLKINRAGHRDRELRDPADLLGAMGLGDYLDRYPGQLSGGMQQRVAIARAYAFNPHVLLMDEPFSALDEFNRDQQRLDLMHFWQAHRKAVLFVTHSVAEAVILSDRIIVMSAGPGRIKEVVEVDLPRPRSSEIFTNPDFDRIHHRVQAMLHDVAATDVRRWEPVGGEVHV